MYQCLLMYHGSRDLGSLIFIWNTHPHTMFHSSVPLALEDLMPVLKAILQDDSPVAIRQACLSLKVEKAFLNISTEKLCKIIECLYLASGLIKPELILVSVALSNYSILECSETIWILEIKDI